MPAVKFIRGGATAKVIKVSSWGASITQGIGRFTGTYTKTTSDDNFSWSGAVLTVTHEKDESAPVVVIVEDPTGNAEYKQYTRIDDDSLSIDFVDIDEVAEGTWKIAIL